MSSMTMMVTIMKMLLVTMLTMLLQRIAMDMRS